jgi:hypothetical protein
VSDRTQIGPTVDAALWREFRENVKDRKGHTRGALGDELENAIREYIRDGSTPTERRIEKRIARIEQAVGAAPTDGGVDAFDSEEHTHAPSRLDVTEKPSANAATDKKVAYLTECVEEKATEDPDELPRKLLVETVKEEYGFRSDTAKRYVEHLVEEFGLVAHPEIDGMLVSAEKKDTLVEQRREEIKEQAEEKL